MLSACTQGVNQTDINPIESSPSSKPVDQSSAQPSSIPTSSLLPSTQPSASPSVSRSPSITMMGRIPRSGVANGSTASNINLNDVQVLSSSVVVAAGSFGLAQISEDGGRTWLLRRFSDNDVWSITTRRGNDLIAGRDAGVFIWDASQQSWQILSTDIMEKVMRLTYFDERNGIALSGQSTQTLWSTGDGGRTWSQVGSVSAGTANNGTAEIRVIDPQALSAIINADGDIYQYQGGTLRQTTARTGCCASNTAFRDGQNGFVFGASAFSTANGGSTWSSTKSIVADGNVLDFSQVNAMSFASPEYGLMTTGDIYKGKMYVTKTGGRNWELLKLPEATVAKINRMHVFVENNTLIGLAFGDYSWDRTDSAFTVYRISVPL